MSKMIERVREAIDSIDKGTFFFRRKIDKSGFEVIHNLDPGGSASDDTMIVVFEGSSDECGAEALRLRSVARARAAIEVMRAMLDEVLTEPAD